MYNNRALKDVFMTCVTEERSLLCACVQHGTGAVDVYTSYTKVVYNLYIYCRISLNIKLNSPKPDLQKCERYKY